ncbi:hypothetical protein ACOME3_000801 [Neoechinorhynchus agilis]
MDPYHQNEFQEQFAQQSTYGTENRINNFMNHATESHQTFDANNLTHWTHEDQTWYYQNQYSDFHNGYYNGQDIAQAHYTQHPGYNYAQNHMETPALHEGYQFGTNSNLPVINRKREYPTQPSSFDYQRQPKQIKIQNAPINVSSNSKNDRVRTNGRYRTPYDDLVKHALEAEFVRNDYITAERKAELSYQLNLTQRQIKIWFQNRRAKNRRLIKRSKEAADAV